MRTTHHPERTPRDWRAGDPTMKTLLKALLICGIFFLANFTAVAQTKPAICSASGSSQSPLMVRSFAGCPFSAKVEITHTQTLGDGSHIVTNGKALIARDSVGRVRYESTTIKDTDQADSGPLTSILIYDPVAGFSYFILPFRNAAWRYKINVPAPTVDDLPRHLSTNDAALSSTTADPREKFVVEDLGSRPMLGVLATGTKSTRTIPIGVEGNDRELSVTNESWISTELGFALLRETSDPRSKHSQMRVTSLQQSEPDASMFQVPAGYTIVDQ
jgi:hypothetical protein